MAVKIEKNGIYSLQKRIAFIWLNCYETANYIGDDIYWKPETYKTKAQAFDRMEEFIEQRKKGKAKKQLIEMRTI